jgi:hypothetical protein
MDIRIYTGRSMWPTFRPGDVLEVRPAATRPRPGDVVIFRPAQRPGGDEVFAHRVTAAGAAGLQTRGDNNPRPDPWRAAPEQVLGVVTHCRRAARVRRVTGGWRGLLGARLRYALRRLGLQLRRPLRAAYAALRASGAPGRLWRPCTERVAVESLQGPLVKVLWRRRTVARWWPRQDRFVCRKPFDLFLAPPGRGSAPQGGLGG